MKKIEKLFILFVLLILTTGFISVRSFAQDTIYKDGYKLVEIKPRWEGYVPKEGFVPNDSTAIKIAEAVWLPIYGKDVLEEKPYKARLKKGVWIVEGSIATDTLHITMGGVAYIEIQKSDGKILKVLHDK
jgi:hypothetical protein